MGILQTILMGGRYSGVQRNVQIEVAKVFQRELGVCSMPIISIQDLVKEFRLVQPYSGNFSALRTFFSPKYVVKRVVDQISLDINEGEVVGYVGPNGAGKSTTIKMLTGILVPTSGTIEVAGLVPWKHRKRNALNIGVVFGQRSHLWWDLPLIESFKLIAKIYGVSQAKLHARLDRFADLLDLETFLGTPVRLLSLGQRMRGDLVAAMLYEPRILYLDEPTIGLDIFAKERIRCFIEEINRLMGTTIILTTHDLNDVERLCQRIIMIDQGRIIHDGSITELKNRYARNRILIAQFEHEDIAVEVSDAAVVRREGAKVWLEYNPETVTAASLIAALNSRYPIVDVSITEPELETVIRKIYED